MFIKSVIAFVFISYEWIPRDICCNAQPNLWDFNAKDDAKAIFEASDRNKAFLDILPNRNVSQCAEINVEFAKLNNYIPLAAEQFLPQSNRPEGSLPDLLYALIHGPRRTKVGYLKGVLSLHYDYRSVNIITEILILSDNSKIDLIEDYNLYYPLPLYNAIDEEIGGDYKNFLIEIISRFRQESYCADSLDEDETVRRLNDERQQKGSWGDHRKELDYLLMEKPIPFVLEVIKKYADSNHGNQFFDDIKKKLSGDLEFGYTNWVDYLQDSNKYMAHRIHDSINEDHDWDATLILIIICFSDNGLYDVNEAFQKEYDGKHIKDFLLEGENPGITRQILAAIADKKSQKITNVVTPPLPPVAPTELVAPPSIAPLVPPVCPTELGTTPYASSPVPPASPTVLGTSTYITPPSIPEP